ncbi:MAG TPA: PD-(D/E)XK nuclease family transposase [Gemmataceae bacterium]|nr:PD-(D/E)XK nuclease family transposase [Gemmataceae bacterium]
MIIGIDPKVDYAFKRLFGRKQNTRLLISLLNAVLDPPLGAEVAAVELLPPFQEDGNGAAVHSRREAQWPHFCPRPQERCPDRLRHAGPRLRAVSRQARVTARNWQAALRAGSRWCDPLTEEDRLRQLEWKYRLREASPYGPGRDSLLVGYIHP